MEIKSTEDGLCWKRVMFKTNKVWVNTDEKGTPVLESGKVLIKYQLNQDHEYRVHENSIRPLGAAPSPGLTPDKKKPKKKKSAGARDGEAGEKEPPPENAVLIYTDGASSGNPGPSGIGVLLKFGKREKEISKFIGTATNNIAELEAIRTGLSAVKNKKLPVRVYTDSSYALGVLTMGWKPKKNMQLIQSTKDLIANFTDIRFIKVKGHAGHRENEIADRLAVTAVENRC